MNRSMRMLLMNNTDKKKREEESRRKIEENRQRDMETQHNLERYRDDTYNEKYGLENRYRGESGTRSRRIPYENPIRMGGGYMAYDDGVQMRYGGEKGRVGPDGDGYVGYGDMMPESRFRDRRGREHYDNGRYAPQSYWGAGGDDEDTYVESRRGGARRRDSSGRFVSSEYSDGYSDREPSSRYWPPGPDNPYEWPPTVPPVYRYQDGANRNRNNQTRQNRSRTENSGQSRPMNKIGFSIDGEWERIPDEFDTQRYHSNASHNGVEDEMMYSTNSRSNGYANSTHEGEHELTKEMAMDWMQNMENEDGTTGPHWTMEQVKQVMAQKNVNCDPMLFWAALNMIYSDYCKVAKKLNVNNIDFYVCMAKAFLDDKDGGGPEEKMYNYYEHIVNQ